MRTFLLACAVLSLAAAPAWAQTFSGRQAPSHRAAYLPKAATRTTVRYAKQTNVEAVVASHGYATREMSGGCCDSGCDTGCSTCASRGIGCCKPALLPCLLDNFQDALICLIPTRAHCCSYPRTCGEPSCSNQPVGRCCDRQPILNSIFSRRCGGGCGGCTASPGCCTAAEAHGMHLMAPPVEELEAPESPFRDDPEMPMQRGARKPSTRTKTTQNWFKKSERGAPVRYASERPSMIIVGSASPIVVSE
jgi:hypothetical protein